MNKVQRSWADVAKDLEGHLDQRERSNSELSKASLVNYHAIRRMRIKGVHNQSSNAKRLCTFFGISLIHNVKVQTGEFDKLVYELGAAWDGSEPHAKLLTKLIRSTKSFRVEGRKES